jgi:hypothetical protein
VTSSPAVGLAVPWKLLNAEGKPGPDHQQTGDNLNGDSNRFSRFVSGFQFFYCVQPIHIGAALGRSPVLPEDVREFGDLFVGGWIFDDQFERFGYSGWLFFHD